MKIGITGSIGSGKSTVVRYLKEKGYKIFSCDEYNKKLLRKNSKAYPILLNKFPVCFKDNKLDKQALANIIFNNKEKKKELEDILHPLIINEMKRQMDKNELIFVEVPLLFESNLDNYFDHILLVLCDEEIALKRLKKRGLSLEESKQRLKNQMSQETKSKRAHYLIYNNGSLLDLYEEIEKWLDKYVRI